jgi:hypothetical protein
MQHKQIPTCYLGKWVSDHGQLISVRKIPVIGYAVNYYPQKGRPRILLRWHMKDEILIVSLSWLSWLETMLLLQHKNDAISGKEILVPELESGPESRWEDEGFGFPWLLPLGVFRQNAA